MIIIFSQIKLEVNKIYGPKNFKTFILHINRQTHKEFRFRVMRESNYNEYKKYYEENYGPMKTEPYYYNFYEISPD